MFPSAGPRKLIKRFLVESSHKLEIWDPHLLLFCNGGRTDTSKYLVEGDSDHYYILDTTSNDVWRIVKVQGLQDILDILKDESRHLTVSRASRPS